MVNPYPEISQNQRDGQKEQPQERIPRAGVDARLKNGRPEQAKRNVLNAHLLSFVPKFQHNTNHSLRERRHVPLVAAVHHSGLDPLPGLTYRPSHELLLFPLSWLTFILIPVNLDNRAGRANRQHSLDVRVCIKEGAS